MQLNSSQKAVVEAGMDPLLVIAGPGAGKTTVLTARIQRLLNESTGSYRKLLGITYTNVAAKALRAKLEAQDPNASDRVLVQTFHGFATRMLQQHGTHIGLPANFSIINEREDRLELLTRAASRVGIHPDRLAGRGEAILRLLGRLYERCQSVDQARKFFANESTSDLVENLFEPYIKQSIEEAQLEFSLLVNLCNRLLSTFSPLAAQTRKIYQHICVDEFQDTNEMQYRLVEIIAGDDPSGLVLLADQDQVIYQWNGASPSRLTEAQARFGMTVMVLPTSYRCPDNIVDAAARLISHNSMRFVAPEYVSEKHGASELTTASFKDEKEEAQWVAGTLAGLERSEWARSVVLARNRRVLEAAFEASTKAGVDSFSPIAKYDFESAPLVMLQSILRLANQPSRHSVLRRLATAFYAMTGHELDPEVIVAKAEESGIDVLTALFNELLRRAKSEEFKALAVIVVEQLVAKKDFRGVSKAVFLWVDSLPSTSLKVAYQDDYAKERTTWHDLESRHQGLQSERITLAEFLRRIDLEAKATEPLGPVKFLTVHGAKGLEFENVFLIGAAEGQFPAYQAVMAGPGSAALEEERRSFFVAVTRAMRRLTLTHASRYFGRPAAVSRFITEMEISGSEVRNVK